MISTCFSHTAAIIPSCHDTPAAIQSFSRGDGPRIPLPFKVESISEELPQDVSVPDTYHIRHRPPWLGVTS